MHLRLRFRIGNSVGSGYLALWLAGVVDLHLLLWQRYAIVMTRHQENQGRVSAASTELLPLQVTWGSQYLISSLGRKGRALPGAFPVCI